MTKKRAESRRQSETLQPVTAGPGIDLADLCDMHPRLPVDMAVVLVLRAALGLQRNNHSLGAKLQVAIESVGLCYVLTWPPADLGTAEQHDFRRITEDGAEAVALAVAQKTRAWRVVRRMQREEYADWLLEYQDKGARKLVAFEVGGTDHGSIANCLREELAQVAKSTDVDQRWAGVVGFKQPQAALQSVKGRIHGRKS